METERKKPAPPLESNAPKQRFRSQSRVRLDPKGLTSVGGLNRQISPRGRPRSKDLRNKQLLARRVTVGTEEFQPWLAASRRTSGLLMSRWSDLPASVGVPLVSQLPSPPRSAPTAGGSRRAFLGSEPGTSGNRTSAPLRGMYRAESESALRSA